MTTSWSRARRLGFFHLSAILLRLWRSTGSSGIGPAKKRLDKIGIFF